MQVLVIKFSKDIIYDFKSNRYKISKVWGKTNSVDKKEEIENICTIPIFMYCHENIGTVVVHRLAKDISYNAKQQSFNIREFWEKKSNSVQKSRGKGYAVQPKK